MVGARCARAKERQSNGTNNGWQGSTIEGALVCQCPSNNLKVSHTNSTERAWEKVKEAKCGLPQINDSSWASLRRANAHIELRTPTSELGETRAEHAELWERG